MAPPPGDSKPDWEILDLLAAGMGHEKRYGSLDMIRAEMTRSIALYADLKENTGTGFSWIKETSRLRVFSSNGEGGMIPFSSLGPVETEVTDDEYPFTAVLGSQRFHLGSGTRTGHSERIRDFGLKGEVELSPEDGGAMNLKSGDTVHVQSRDGAIIRQIRLKKGLRPGLLFIPTAFHGNDAMNLLGLIPLENIRSQGLKTCRVKVRKAQWLKGREA
jgi:anaerobic selenocysteine-containing dehydrogenase